MSTLAELLQDIANECGPTLRHEDVAEAAAAMVRREFAVIPLTIDRCGE